VNTEQLFRNTWLQPEMMKTSMTMIRNALVDRSPVTRRNPSVTSGLEIL